MLTQKGFWTLLMSGMIVFWCVIIVWGIFLFPGVPLYYTILVIAAITIHVLEWPIALKIGKAKNIPAFRTVAKTLVFGFTWWLPLRMDVIDR